MTDGVPMEVRALTVRQPWASLIACDAKTIETRSWRTDYRGPLLVHAGKACQTGDVGSYNVEQDNPRGTLPAYLLRGDSLAWPYRLPLGAVVAVATLADCVPIVGSGAEGAVRTVDVDDNGSLWLVEPERYPDRLEPDDFRDYLDDLGFGGVPDVESYEQFCNSRSLVERDEREPALAALLEKATEPRSADADLGDRREQM